MLHPSKLRQLQLGNSRRDTAAREADASKFTYSIAVPLLLRCDDHWPDYHPVLQTVGKSSGTEATPKLLRFCRPTPGFRLLTVPVLVHCHPAIAGNRCAIPALRTDSRLYSGEGSSLLLNSKVRPTSPICFGSLDGEPLDGEPAPPPATHAFSSTPRREKRSDPGRGRKFSVKSPDGFSSVNSSGDAVKEKNTQEN
jgi:hypothetical protein